MYVYLLFRLCLLHDLSPSWTRPSLSLSLPFSSITDMCLPQGKGPSLQMQPRFLCRYSYLNTQEVLIRNIPRITHMQQEGLFPESLIHSENQGMTCKKKISKYLMSFSLLTSFSFLAFLFPLLPPASLLSLVNSSSPSSFFSFSLMAPFPLPSLPPSAFICSHAHLIFA